MSEPLLAVRDLHVWLSPPRRGGLTHIVRGLSLCINPGQRLGLVGESGCGKSTAVLSLLGLLPARAQIAGCIRFAGTDLLGGDGRGAEGLHRHRGREIAVVMQSSMNMLNPVHRIEAQLVEAMRPEVRRSKDTARERVAELLERVRLPVRVGRSYPHELSGGMRQRVGIAMALAAEPRLLIADEPTTALDTVVQARIMELLDHLCADTDLAVLLVSHNLPLTAEFCDQLAVMYAGTIVEHGKSGEVCDSPAHPYTRLLFDATADLGSRRSDVRAIAGTPPSLSSEYTCCPFLPRCPDAIERCCDDGVPVVTEAHDGGGVACYAARAASRRTESGSHR